RRMSPAGHRGVGAQSAREAVVRLRSASPRFPRVALLPEDPAHVHPAWAVGTIRLPTCKAPGPRDTMNPIDLAVIAVYVTGCTALGAWLGSRSQGLKGYFLGESNIPTWAVMISIVATETSTA